MLVSLLTTPGVQRYSECSKDCEGHYRHLPTLLASLGHEYHLSDQLMRLPHSVLLVCHHQGDDSLAMRTFSAGVKSPRQAVAVQTHYACVNSTTTSAAVVSFLATALSPLAVLLSSSAVLLVDGPLAHPHHTAYPHGTRAILQQTQCKL